MPEVIDCPSCGRKLRLANDLLGRLVQCPACEATFRGAGEGGTQAGPTEGASTVTWAPPQQPADDTPLALSLQAREISSEVDDQGSPPPAAAPSPQRSDAPQRKAERDQCPYCRESIPAEARECPYCGELLDEEYEGDERPWEREGAIRRDCEPHRGPLVLTLGIIGLVVTPVAPCCSIFGVFFAASGLALGITSWVMGQHDLKKMTEGVKDSQGRGQTKAGMICGIIATGLACVMILGLGLLFTWLVLR